MRLSSEQPVLTTETLELVPTPKRVRVTLGGKTVADSDRATLLLEKGHMPVYYFPKQDVDMAFLTPTDHSTRCPRKGQASYWTVAAGDKTATNAAWGYPEPLEGAEPLSNYLAFYWNKMDTWFEEDERVHVHPRNPYHRVDTRRSSRHVRVVHGGETIAETRRPVLLFETDLPTRYYIPAADVRREYLEASSTTSSCPYKGDAKYDSVRVGEETTADLIWSYPQPLAEAFDVRDMFCFYSEKVDSFYVDGERQER